MAGIKISALPTVAAVLGTDIYPAVQAGVTSQETVNQLTSYMNANAVLNSTAQVTGLTSALAGFLPLTGGTLSGPLFLSGNPTLPNQAANKAYVDLTGGGFTVILSTQAATTANLNATQAGAGIGATLTNAGAQAAFAVDGYTASLNDRILVKNQTLTQHNGVYSVTTLGSGSTNWVLTRTTDYDTAAQIKPGTLIAVNNGTVNGTTSWLETATVVTVDTDPILFSQFTFAPAAFLQIANNLSELTATAATARANLGLTAAAIMTLPVSPANGGTGVNNGTNTITLGGNLITVGSLTFAGAFPAILTLTGSTSITLPTSGTLISANQPTINQPNIVGVTTNSNAAAGSVGEYVFSPVTSGSAVACVSGTPKNITSISLTAGDWDVFGNISSIVTVNMTQIIGWVSLTSATVPDVSLYAGAQFTSSTPENIQFATPFLRVSTSVTVSVFLSIRATFSTGAVSACGGIFARRVR